MKRLLLLASNVATQRVVMRAGRAMEVAVVAVATVAAAQREARGGRFTAGLVVVDDLPVDGSERDLLDALAPSPVLLLTTAEHMARALTLLPLGFADVTRLPVQPEYLLHRLQHTLRQSPAPPMMAPSTKGDALLGDSPPMQEIRQRLQRLATTDLTVAIYGESGTGKELAARTIHNWSARAMGPLVVANCAAMPESLFENELFGHERGSYTGAARTTDGLVEAAAGGTLVLDEIGELALPLQSKLLRFLQFGTYRRVGGTRELQSDARVVAVTNRFLPEAVAAKTFRADLFYRIHLLHAVMPPLRDRREDIPLLTETIAERFGQRYGRAAPAFSDAALERMQAHDWPVNVRELEGVVQTTLAMHPGDGPITADQVEIVQWDTSPPDVGAPDWGPDGDVAGAGDATAPGRPRLRVAGGGAGTASGASPRTSDSWDRPLATLSDARQRVMERFEVDFLRRVLTATGGNVAEAARRAGTDRKTLWRLLRKHDMDAVAFKKSRGN